MLIEFKVKGFKNFKEEFIFNLKSGKYNFSEKAIKNNIVKTSLIYGENGTGKSNLGLAIFDIILHLTDKEKKLVMYKNYLNLYNSKEAIFNYEFNFDGNIVEYSYVKENPQDLVLETFKINSKIITQYNYKNHEFENNLKGSNSLRNPSKNISFIKYVYNNISKESKEVKIIEKFINFVDNMLFFSSLSGNYYQGFYIGSEKIPDIIINNNKLKDFESFLKKEANIEYKLIAEKDGDENKIYCIFENKKVNFFEIASKGTLSLSLFYSWLTKFNEVSLVFIDEFDAFYHIDLAKSIIKILLDSKVQSILTTHDTTLMTNNLLRPDCYFIINNKEIKNISEKTEKELREAHNIEKMYRAGSFQ